MKRALTAAVLAGLIWLVGSNVRPAHAGSKLPGGKPVAARVTYGDTMLVLVSDQGVAAVVFPEGTETGARFQFRYESKDGKVKENGSGLVFEKFKVGRPTGKAGGFELIDEGSETRVKAGPIEIEWSSCGKPYGWVYYVPEKVHACVAPAEDYDTIELKRYFKFK